MRAIAVIFILLTFFCCQRSAKQETISADSLAIAQKAEGMTSDTTAVFNLAAYSHYLGIINSSDSIAITLMKKGTELIGAYRYFSDTSRQSFQEDNINVRPKMYPLKGTWSVANGESTFIFEIDYKGDKGYYDGPVSVHDNVYAGLWHYKSSDATIFFSLELLDHETNYQLKLKRTKNENVEPDQNPRMDCRGITEIKIMDSSGKEIQSFNPGVSCCAGFPTIRLEDMNFDGYADLVMNTQTIGMFGVAGEIFIFQPNKNIFAMIEHPAEGPSPGLFISPEADVQHRVMIASNNTTNRNYSTYQYNGAVFLPYAVYSYDESGKTNVYFYKDEEQP